MPFPMTTGYERQDDQGLPPTGAGLADDPGAATPAQPNEANPLAQPSGPAPRTGQDVLSKCLSQANVCKPAGGGDQGTTAPQGDMSYGADPGYGA